MTTWGPMQRVVIRANDRRVEDVQRGTKWLVRRVVLKRLQKTTRNGIPRAGEERFQTIVRELGHVYADNKSDAEAIAQRRYGGTDIVVQSAISAKLFLENQEALQKYTKGHHHKGRSTW